MESRIHSRNSKAPFSPRYLRLFWRRSPHLSVQWSTYEGLAISLSINSARLFFDAPATKAWTSSGMGNWPLRSSETRRRNAASSTAGDGWIFRRWGLASVRRAGLLGLGGGVPGEAGVGVGHGSGTGGGLSR